MSRAHWTLGISAGVLGVTALVLGLRMGGMQQPSDALEEVAATVRKRPEIPADLAPEALREQARAEADCATALPLWWAVVDREGDDLEAYRAIARCGRSDRIDAVVKGTTRLFEESRVLGMVPALLDELQVRDLVPILNQVETRADKGVGDYVIIAELRARTGDAAGAVAAFRQALSLDPHNGEVHIAMGHALVREGRLEEARQAFRDGLAGEDVELRMGRLYAAAVAWPLTFLALIGGVLGVVVGMVWRRESELVLAVDRAVNGDGRRMLVSGGGLALALLGAAFYLTGDRVAFGLLTGLGLGGLAWTALVPLRTSIARAAWATASGLVAVAAGRADRLLTRLQPRHQLALLLLVAVAIFFVIPLVGSFDIRIGLLFLAAMLLFSTVGSLIRAVLEQTGSLRSTLRWLAFAGTVPFLLFFVYVEQEQLLEPLRTGRLLAAEHLDRLAGYLLVWLLGVAFALVLARVLSRSILDPLDRVVATLAEVRSGDFGARTGVRRRDEVGALAEAVDDMARALRDREEMRGTFRRYLDPEVAERLLSGDQRVLSGQDLHATVLFSDVRGFTSLSERLPPAEVVAQLNAYFARMAPLVREWGGVIDKFMGDGMLAVWDVPEPRRDGPHVGVPGEVLAVRAALAMLDALDTHNAELRERGLPDLRVGIGITAGHLIAGPVGSPDRLEYTVVGDTVNTAARLESAARGDTPLLVSEAVAERVRGLVPLVEQEPMALKGKSEPVRVWAVGPP